MFTNHQIDGYTYETRFIASWLKSGGSLKYGEDYDNFYKWLLSLDITEDEAKHIVFLAENGKIELEISASRFIKGITK